MRANAAEWTPDQPPLEAPGSGEVKNVYPIMRGYAPIPALVEISSNALTTKAKGYYAAHAADGATLTFAGDSDHLYSYSLTTFTDISRVASPYTTQDDDLYWEFAQFGDRIIATTIENAPQYYDLDISTHFADLPGSPPRARHVAVVRDFLVFGFTNSSPSEVRWSGNGLSEVWTAEVSESSSQTLQDGGIIRGIIGGEVGYIIQDRQIVKMTYVGPPLHFQFDVLDQGYGTNAGYSIVRVGRTAFWRSNVGFYKLDLATGVPTAIGTEKVDRWFLDNSSHGFIKYMHGAVDPVRKIIWWDFISNNSSGTDFDAVIGYQWELNRWFHAEFDHELTVAAFTEAITLDEIDNFFVDLDTVPISLDSDYWLGGLTQLRCFTTNHKLALFEGDNLAATIDTTEIEPVPARRSMVTNLRPLCDTTEATVRINSRERLSDTAGQTIAGIMQTNGDVALLSSGRSHKARIEIPAGAEWTFFQGMDLDAVDDGLL